MEGKTGKEGSQNDRGKRHEMSTSGPASEPDDREELGDDDAPD